MKEINYKGYTITQTSNNHITIKKDGKMVFHASCDKKYNEVELKEHLEIYMNIIKVVEDE